MAIPLPRRRRSAPQPTDADLEAAMHAERRRVTLNGLRLPMFQAAARAVALTTGVAAAIIAHSGSLPSALLIALIVAILHAFITGAGALARFRLALSAQQDAIDRLRSAMAATPTTMERELMILLQHEGVSPEGSMTIMKILAADEEAWLRMLLEKRYRLSVEVPAKELRWAAAEALAALSSALALVPGIWLATGPALIWGGIISTLLLAFIGMHAARLAQRSLVMTMVEWWLIAASATVGGYLLGIVLPHI